MGGVPSEPSRHILAHLSPSEARIALVLIHPVTVTEAAAALHLSRRSVEYQWHRVRDVLGLPGSDKPGSVAATRVALTRVMLGIDPCPRCGRY